MIGYILVSIAGLGSLVCWILVLIKMFKTDKTLVAVLGIICPLWAFIWGWMNSAKLGLKQIMLGWSVCIVLSIIGNALLTSAIVSAAQEQQRKATPVTTP